MRAGPAQEDRMKLIAAAFVIGCLLVAIGCATPPTYEEAFSAKEQVKGNAESIPAPMETTWASAMEVLSRQGFIVQQTDAKSRIILAGREMRDANDPKYTYTINANLTFVPLGNQVTRVMVAANQTTEFHRKEYRWWKLLWIIPLFPVGSDYTSVVVNRDTVRQPQFYAGFFDALKQACDEAKELSPPPTPPIARIQSNPTEVPTTPTSAVPVMTVPVIPTPTAPTDAPPSPSTLP